MPPLPYPLHVVALLGCSLPPVSRHNGLAVLRSTFNAPRVCPGGGSNEGARGLRAAIRFEWDSWWDRDTENLSLEVGGWGRPGRGKVEGRDAWEGSRRGRLREGKKEARAGGQVPGYPTADRYGRGVGRLPEDRTKTGPRAGLHLERAMGGRGKGRGGTGVERSAEAIRTSRSLPYQGTSGPVEMREADLNR